jgi:hypothetical protein
MTSPQASPTTSSTVSSSPVFRSDVKNHFPDVVFLGFSNGSSTKRRLELLMDLIINEQTISVGSFKVSFGLQSGELRLRMDNASMPPLARAFKNPLSKAVKNRRSLVVSSKKLDDRSISAQSEAALKTVGASAKMTRTDKNSTSKEQTAATTDEFSYDRYLVTLKGDSTTPAWVFSALPADPTVLGTVTRQRLGIVHLDGKACTIGVAFEAPDSQLQITAVEGLLLTISPRKKAVVWTLLLKFIRRQYKEILSEGVVYYGAA